MFTKVQHQKKWEIILPFDKNMNVLKACINQLYFYKTWVFVYGTSEYALHKRSYY